MAEKEDSDARIVLLKRDQDKQLLALEGANEEQRHHIKSLNERLDEMTKLTEHYAKLSDQHAMTIEEDTRGMRAVVRELHAKIDDHELEIRNLQNTIKLKYVG